MIHIKEKYWNNISSVVTNTIILRNFAVCYVRIDHRSKMRAKKIPESIAYFCKTCGKFLFRTKRFERKSLFRIKEQGRRKVQKNEGVQ